MARYRRRIDIIADVLKAAGSNATRKTRIMYIANLSHQLLEKYLFEAVNLGFIRLNNDGYEVTGKGRVFLEKYSEFSSRYSAVERELEKLNFEREVLERMCMLQRKSKVKVGFKRVNQTFV